MIKFYFAFPLHRLRFVTAIKWIVMERKLIQLNLSFKPFWLKLKKHEEKNLKNSKKRKTSESWMCQCLVLHRNFFILSNKMINFWVNLMNQNENSNAAVCVCALSFLIPCVKMCEWTFHYAESAGDDSRMFLELYSFVVGSGRCKKY